MNEFSKKSIDINKFASVGNQQNVDLSLFNADNIFPDHGLYLGDYENLIFEKFPALLHIEKYNGVCFLTTPDNREEVHQAIQSIALRSLLEVKKGLLKYHLYDPTGLGMNLIYLSKISTRIKGENILVDDAELKRMLEKAVGDIPSVIQKVLGHEYRDYSLVEYNRVAGQLAKSYNFLFIVDYPHSFNSETNKLLFKILNSGKKAGFFTFISVDTTFDSGSSFGINPTEILSLMPCIYESEGQWYVKGLGNDDSIDKTIRFNLNTDIPENLDEIIEFVNETARQVKKVEVTLKDKLTTKNLWSLDARDGIDIPIGKVSYTDIQNFTLSINDGLYDHPHHCLIGGSTGQGKTVLLHSIICNTAWLYSPEEINLVLMDYKEGIEFNVYQQLPHVKVLTIHGELEYGVSVIEFIDEEIRRRGKLFKTVGAKDLAKYKAKTGENLPRILIIIDEFQKLIDGTDRSVSNLAVRALDDIGRRGRSLGINLILATQSLTGLDTSQVLSHLGLRVMLRLNKEMDCDQMLGFNNHIPYTFTSAGEAIYNAASGRTEGNIRFQTAFLRDDEILDIIEKLHQKAKKEFKELPHKQFIYDGSIKPSSSTNPEYNNTKVNEKACTVYIGDSISIREEHVFYKLRKQNESNVLLVGQDTESAVSFFKHSSYQVSNQSSKSSSFYIFNKLNVDSQFYPVLSNLKTPKVISEDYEIEKIISQTLDKLESRMNGKESTSRIVLGLVDVNNIRPLRKIGMRLSPVGETMSKIILDGPNYNVHVICYSSSYSRFNQVFDAQSILSNFDTRIELNGGQGSKIYGIVSDMTDLQDGIARIHSPFEQDINKFKPYSIS